MLQWFPDAGYQSARTVSPSEGNRPGMPCDRHRLLPAEFPAVGSRDGCLSVCLGRRDEVGSLKVKGRAPGRRAAKVSSRDVYVRRAGMWGKNTQKEGAEA